MPWRPSSLAYDILWSLVAVAHLVLVAVALRVWFPAQRDTSNRLLELLAIVLLPVLGPLAYLTGRGRARRRAGPDI